MATIPTINKDTDQTVQITIKDETGTPVDINNIAGLVIKVFQERYDIQKFSLNAQVGFSNIDVIDAVNGIVNIYIDNANLDCCIVGKQIFYEAKTTAVDINFSGGTVEKSTGKILLAIFDDSKLKGINFV